jgi:hypothetical protein
MGWGTNYIGLCCVEFGWWCIEFGWWCGVDGGMGA